MGGAAHPPLVTTGTHCRGLLTGGSPSLTGPEKSAALQNTYAGECIALVFFSLFLLLFSRAVFVFPILYAHNQWAESKLTHQEIIVSW